MASTASQNGLQATFQKAQFREPDRATELPPGTVDYILGKHGAYAGTGPTKSKFYPQFSTASGISRLFEHAIRNGEEIRRHKGPDLSEGNGYVIIATMLGGVGIDRGFHTERYVMYLDDYKYKSFGGISIPTREVTNMFPRMSGY